MGKAEQRDDPRDGNGDDWRALAPSADGPDDASSTRNETSRAWECYCVVRDRARGTGGQTADCRLPSLTSIRSTCDTATVLYSHTGKPPSRQHYQPSNKGSAPGRGTGREASAPPSALTGFPPPPGAPVVRHCSRAQLSPRPSTLWMLPCAGAERGGERGSARGSPTQLRTECMDACFGRWDLRTEECCRPLSSYRLLTVVITWPGGLPPTFSGTGDPETGCISSSSAGLFCSSLACVCCAGGLAPVSPLSQHRRPVFPTPPVSSVMDLKGRQPRLLDIGSLRSL